MRCVCVQGEWHTAEEMEELLKKKEWVMLQVDVTISHA